jgi:type I pantothenate kinase
MDATHTLSVVWSREEWRALGANVEQPWTGYLESGSRLTSLEEVAEIYVPLAAYVRMLATEHRAQADARSVFFDRPMSPPTFVVGISGSVAVGKSTTADVLVSLLGNGKDAGDVALMTTDAFLWPNQILEERGLMGRKGFPESFDTASLIAALTSVKSGADDVRVPVYSHETYDIVADEYQLLGQPEILVLEGVNVLQAQPSGSPGVLPLVSDFVDLSIYVDAPIPLLEHWYLERFLGWRAGAHDRDSFFGQLAVLSDDVALDVARGVWANVNLVNLVEFILPTRERADVVLRKGEGHRVEQVCLRVR